MNCSENIILEALRSKPIGETNSFVWFISSIGILALHKNKNSSENFPERESAAINLDLSKEEKEFYTINNEKLILFYS